MKKNTFIFLLGICSLLFVSCEKDEQGPLVENSFVPESPMNVVVENGPGAARISYDLSSDPELLYVLAVYNSNERNEKEVKSSVFKDYLLIEGFGEAKEYNVTLYAVSRSEIRSEPVEVLINPTTPPVKTVFETLELASTFGGAQLQLNNEGENEYTVYTLTKSSDGDQWIEYDRSYTSAREISYAVRGLEPVEVEFAIYLEDKWKNISDTLYQQLTPLYEEEFDKSLWSDARLADDSNVPRYGPLSELWTPGSTTYFFMSPETPGLTLPNWISIDLGREYVFGRLHVDLTNHNDNWKYTGGTPQEFEIWGTNNATTNWDDWTLLGEFEIVKPSGLPVGQLSAEDNEQINAGHDFDFPFQNASFRYIRFKTIDTFGGNPDVNFREITLYGQVPNE